MVNLLARLKLLDPDGRVSLTNLALYVVLGVFVYCVGRAGTVDITALGALLGALATYRVKVLQADTVDDKAASRDVEKLKTELAESKRSLELAQRSVSSSAVRPSALPAGLR